jgi:hypothetical protein
MLSFQVSIAGIIYHDRRLANTVWSLLENYGFGSIERIINWYDTEKRKDLMANIVLNNEDYVTKLGYGNETGTLDYAFVVKLAVLTFADWVDITYVENSWIGNMAAAFDLNIRLADLLNGVFEISGFVLSSIRSQLNNAWEGVKSAGEFIVDAVIHIILDGFVSIMQTSLETIAIVLSQLIPETISFNNNIMYINDIAFGIKRTPQGIGLIFNDMQLEIINFFKEVDVNVETLSVEAFTIGSAILLIATNILVPVLAKNHPGAALIAIIISALGQLFANIGMIYNSNQDDLEYLMIYYLINAVLLLSSSFITFGNIYYSLNPTNPMFSKTWPFIKFIILKRPPTAEFAFIEFLSYLIGIGGFSIATGVALHHSYIPDSLLLTFLNLAVVIIGTPISLKFLGGHFGLYDVQFHLLIFSMLHALIFIILGFLVYLRMD